MKRNIFMYLFFFALLFAIFEFVNYKKILDSKQGMITGLKSQVDHLEAINDSLTNPKKNVVETSFSLATDDKAKAYFEDLGYSVKSIDSLLLNELISRNNPRKDNALVPYKGSAGPMRINRIQVLNHRWVVAEFTDSQTWGEVLISYFLDEQGKLSFDSEEAFLYPN